MSCMNMGLKIDKAYKIGLSRSQKNGFRWHEKEMKPRYIGDNLCKYFINATLFYLYENLKTELRL
jgi:hypothetical protein